MDFYEMYDEEGNPIIYEITLADGTKLKNLQLNGNNWVSPTELTEADFEDKLSTVTFTDGKNTYTHENMRLAQVMHYTDGWYFILLDIPKEELEKMKTQADIQYIAMMANVDLEA